MIQSALEGLRALNEMEQIAETISCTTTETEEIAAYENAVALVLATAGAMPPRAEAIFTVLAEYVYMAMTAGTPVTNGKWKPFIAMTPEEVIVARKHMYEGDLTDVGTIQNARGAMLSTEGGAEQKWENEAKSNATSTANAADIKSRDDLSFTKRDENGGLNNWVVPHDKEGNWHAGVETGFLHFAEVAELASHDETDAYHAMQFAMNDLGWKSSGWGIECGFSEAMARAAIVGLRALRSGAEVFIPADK